jgi:glycosyltransferase involved in cell wall biosynthesis
MIGGFSESGGIKTHIQMLSKSLLAEKDVSIHIIAPSTEEYDVIEDGIFVHFIQFKSMTNLEHLFNNFRYMLPKYRYTKSIKAIIYKIIEINPDIVHVHGTYLPFSMVLILIKKLIDYPVILTVHASMQQEINSTSVFPKKQYIYLKLIPLFYYMKKSFDVADKIIVVSEPIKTSITSWTKNKDKISVIPNGVNLNEFDSSRGTENIRHPSILFLGRLVKVKGCDILIRSLPTIKKSYPNIHVYIAGEGNQKHFLQLLAHELNVIENLTFLGHIEGKKKCCIIKSVDLCVFPSRYESFGLAVLEAMACGKAVVASNIGGLPDIVIDCESGYLFESANIEDFSEKVTQLLKDENLRLRMGEVGRSRAINLFEWKLISSETFNKYEECLNERSKKNC